MAVWRLVGTLILSLAAGFITHYLVQKHWLPTNVLKSTKGLKTQNKPYMIKNAWYGLLTGIKNLLSFKSRELIPAVACCTNNTTTVTQIQPSVSYNTISSQADLNMPDLKQEVADVMKHQAFGTV